MLRVVALALALVSGCGGLPSHPRTGTCPATGAAIVVEADAHAMWLCRDGISEHGYKVSLGAGGLGKRKEGDKKTPLGSYPLGAPRASSKFHTFIPVGYPTADQRKQGATGGDVGVHGPSRKSAWLGAFNAWTDWTHGCIAVASDREIREIADWVKHAAPSRISIMM